MLSTRHTLLIAIFFSLSLSYLPVICMELCYNQAQKQLATPLYNGIQRPKDNYDINVSSIPFDHNQPFYQANNITTVQIEGHTQRFDVCFTVAITEQLGITGQAPTKLKVSLGSDLITECDVINKYYNQIELPTHDCLVVYTNNFTQITHFANVTTPSTTSPELSLVKSKWGTSSAILEHELFNVPTDYGDNAYFFDMKNQFKQNKLNMLQLIQADIAQSPIIKKRLFHHKALLLQLANGKNVFYSSLAGFNEEQNIADKAWYLLKTSMGLSPNTCNKNRKTILMLAAQRNDLKMVELFLQMGASINQKDKNGDTALILASRGNCDKVTYSLLGHGADETIANNEGERAQITQEIKKQVQQWNSILLFIADDELLDFGDERINNLSSVEKIRYILTECTKPNINAQNPTNGKTPLMIAAYKQNQDAVKLLLEHGASTDIQDNTGHTALDYANGNKEIMKLINNSYNTTTI